jgi:DNA mismatch endonuclease (patch repair protein)
MPSDMSGTLISSGIGSLWRLMVTCLLSCATISQRFSFVIFGMPSNPFSDKDFAKSRQMARVRSKNTEPEIAVRQALHARGYRFRLHRKDLPGRPDIVLPRHRLVIFVHGCFWHGCIRCDRGLRQAKTNASFWSAKLAANKERDLRNIAELTTIGWKVAIVWECDARDAQRLAECLDGCLLPVRICY